MTFHSTGAIVRKGKRRVRKDAAPACRKSPPTASFSEIYAVPLSPPWGSRAGNGARKPCTARVPNPPHMSPDSDYIWRALALQTSRKGFLTAWRRVRKDAALFLVSPAGKQADQPAQKARRPYADHPHAHRRSSLPSSPRTGASAQQHKPRHRQRNAQRDQKKLHRKAQKDDQHPCEHQEYARQAPPSAPACAHAYPLLHPSYAQAGRFVPPITRQADSSRTGAPSSPQWAAAAPPSPQP